MRRRRASARASKRRILAPLLAWMATVVWISGGMALPEHAQSAQATIPLERLARDAELIVRGAVSAITVSEQARFITINVEQLIKGDLPPTVSRISVRAPAGLASNTPVYQEREDVILFLRRIQGMNAVQYETIGGIQGKYEIRDGYVPTERMTVEEFIKRIRRTP